MADDNPDIREVEWHPRHTRNLLGHDEAQRRMRKAFDTQKMHHAWLITGPKGIGKASLAYRFAGFVLAGPHERDGTELGFDQNSRTAHWILARAHPDLFVLERRWEGKTKKLKTETAVIDARGLTEFFSMTAGSGGWRVAIIDYADDLNNESANALLKLIEEPPPNCLLLLLSNQPGRLLRTLRSRCLRIDLQPLSLEDTLQVLAELPLDEKRDAETLNLAARLSRGSPGRALDLMDSNGAKSFAAFQALAGITPATLVEFGNRFSSKSATADDFEIFCELLEEWVAVRTRDFALQGRGRALADAYSAIGHSIRQTNALNLDRRQTIIHALSLIDDAMKVA